MRGNALWLLWLTCVSIAILFPIAAGNGVPAFQHDWAWPIVRSQCIPLASAGFEPWHEVALGMPAVYPESYVYHVLAGSSCVVLGPNAGLLLLLFGALLFCAYGYRRFADAIAAREGMQRSFFTAFAVATLAIANPIVVNKLQAGHLKFFLGYAILPWIAAASMQTSRRTAAFTLGILLGAAALDPQFLAFGTAVVLLFALYARNRSWINLGAALAIAIAINLPQIVPALSSSGAAGLSVLSPVLFWQRSQSGHVVDALRLTGYIGGYASRSLPHWMLSLYWLVPACALLLPLLRFRVRLLFVYAAAAAGIAIVAGWNTPLAPIWTYAFAHITALALFRELYNAIAIVMVAYAAGLSIGLCALRERAPVAAYGASICITALSAAIGWHAAQGIPHYTPTASEARTLDELAAPALAARFATVPGTAPVTNAQYPNDAGLSPWSLSFANRGVLFSATPSYAEMYTHALLRDGSPMAQTEMLRDGVGLVRYLSGWRTANIAQADPATRRAESRHFKDYRVTSDRTVRVRDASLVSVEPFSAHPAGLDQPYDGARDVRALQGGSTVVLQDFFADISPEKGWARTALLPLLPAWTYTEPLGLFTLRSNAALRIPGAKVVAGDASGTIRSQECTALAALNGHFKLFDCRANPRFAGKAPIVISEARTDAIAAGTHARQGSYGTAAIVSYRPWRITARIRAAQGSAVVLREAYEDGWTSSISGARHVMVDGYANAWIAPRRLDTAVTFYYAPSSAFFAALAMSMLTLFASAAALIALRRENA